MLHFPWALVMLFGVISAVEEKATDEWSNFQRLSAQLRGSLRPSPTFMAIPGHYVRHILCVREREGEGEQEQE